MNHELTFEAMMINAVKALWGHQLLLALGQYSDLQDRTRDLRLERHEDDSIEDLVGVPGPFSGLEQPVQDGSSKNQVGDRAHGRPQYEEDLE